MNESDVESMKSLDQTKEEYMFDVLRKCKSNPTAFTLPLDAYFPKLDKNFFEIEEKEIDETIKIYSNQCAAIFDTGMINDKTIIEILAIGQKNGVKYLQNLADLFCRDRIKYHLQTKDIKCRSLDVIQWSGLDSKHFNLPRIDLPVQAGSCHRYSSQLSHSRIYKIDLILKYLAS